MRVTMVVGVSTLTLAALLGGCEGESVGKTAATLPAPKAGLWRETILRDRHPMSIIGDLRACLDADARSRLSAMSGQADKAVCQGPRVSRDKDGGYHFNDACDLGPGGRMVTQGELTGDLSSRYRVHSEIDTSGAGLASLNGRHVIDMEADFLGPCPTGVSPGEVLLANGMKVNMARLRSLAEALSGG